MFIEKAGGGGWGHMRVAVQELVSSWQSHHLVKRNHSLQVSTASMTHPGTAESSGVIANDKTNKIVEKWAEGTQKHACGEQFLFLFLIKPENNWQLSDFKLDFFTAKWKPWLVKHAVICNRVLNRFSHLTVTAKCISRRRMWSLETPPVIPVTSILLCCYI